MIDDDGWTCMCGHEIGPDTGDCIVWEYNKNVDHRFADNSRYCKCCGRDIYDVEYGSIPGDSSIKRDRND